MIYYVGFPMQEVRMIKPAIQTMKQNIVNLCSINSMFSYHISLFLQLLNEFQNTYITYAYGFSSRCWSCKYNESPLLF